MNEKQPFEQRMSDKLQRLPLPDTESSWQQMRVLLDEKMPRSGGFKPYGRWWWTGMIAVFFTAVIWFVHEQYMSADKNTVAKKEINALKPTDNFSKETEAGPKNNLSPSSTSAEKLNGSEQGNSVKKESNNQTSVKALNDNTSTLNKTGDQKTGKANATPINEKDEKKNIPGEKQSNSSADNGVFVDDKNSFSDGTVRTNNGNSKKENNLKNNGMNISADKNGTVAGSLLTVPGAYSASDSKTSLSKNNPDGNSKLLNEKTNIAGKAGSENAWSDVIIETSDPAIVQNGQQHSYNYRNTAVDLAESESAINTEAAITEAFANGSVGSVRVSTAVLKKASIVAAIVNDKSRSKRTGEGFSLGKLLKSVNLPYEGENWWAAGLALNGGVATGSQNRVNYNINAKQGAALDYIPSPYLQYHVNSNLYLQTEFNFSAPQYTAQLLVAQKMRELPSSNDKLLQSTYVQKLYYFNLPLSLYYSPVRNLFFNAGLQFSSLQSGLKLVEERKMSGAAPSPTDPVYTSEVLKFKDDTIAARLTPNEWRWETGANYYLSRFTIGLKYNNSFSDLVKIQPAPGVPVTSSRNNTFLFFLRYNLWESRKKGSDKNYTSSLIK